MSFAKNKRQCVERLANMFERGITLTTTRELFDGIQVDESEKHALCETLKKNSLIKATYEMGQRLPYEIEILPLVVEARDREQSDNKLERIKTRLLSRWSIAIVVVIFVVVAAVIRVAATLLTIWDGGN